REWRRRDLRADRWTYRATHSLLRQAAGCADARSALRLHSLRLARRSLPAARGRTEGRAGRRRLGGGHYRCRIAACRLSPPVFAAPAFIFVLVVRPSACC